MLSKEPGVSEAELIHRANVNTLQYPDWQSHLRSLILTNSKAILMIGIIYKDVQADESPEERRELER